MENFITAMLNTDDTTVPHSNPLLPPELATSILSQAPDARSLRNLILSAPCFYYGFFTTSRRILHAVLFNEFGPALLPIALAIHHCKRLTLVDFHHAASQSEEWSNQQLLRETRNGILSTMARQARIPEDWTFSDSLALTELHDDVDWFALEFAATLSGPSEGNAKHECDPLGRKEMDRIRSAFFRFDLYRRVFSKRYRYDERPDPDERKEMLLDRFAPWENEQLATAYEYLLHRLSIGLSKIIP